MNGGAVHVLRQRQGVLTLLPPRQTHGLGRPTSKRQRWRGQLALLILAGILWQAVNGLKTVKFPKILEIFDGEDFQPHRASFLNIFSLVLEV